MTIPPYTTLACETAAPHVLLVRLNRPEVRNAFNTAMGRELLDLWTRLTEDGGDWRWRHHHRRHFRGGDAAILGLGLGLGLGSMAYGNYYDPYYYDPYPRYVQPRRIYRTERLSSAHVRWCYDRYRSYRAWDNTFQPNYGPRKQCWSPYS